MSNETVFLVAVSVTTPDHMTPAQVETALHTRLNNPGFRTLGGSVHVDSWWIAEDERHDGSDCDSAVFVPNHMSQRVARTLLGMGA